MKQIQLIQSNGIISEIYHMPTLEEMQGLVGGHVEHVRCLDRIEEGRLIYSSMYVNDSGLIDGLRRNEMATHIYQRNIREQFPGENPFKQAKEAMSKQAAANGIAIIDATPKDLSEAGYEYDPFIAGDAIYFAGYTVEEVNILMEDEDE